MFERDVVSCQMDSFMSRLPNITCHRILRTLQPLRGHVAPRPHKRVCHRIDKLPGDPEVANFDFPLTVDQNIARLDVAVYDFVLFSQVAKAP